MIVIGQYIHCSVLIGSYLLLVSEDHSVANEMTRQGHVASRARLAEATCSDWLPRAGPEVEPPNTCTRFAITEDWCEDDRAGELLTRDTPVIGQYSHMSWCVLIGQHSLVTCFIVFD